MVVICSHELGHDYRIYVYDIFGLRYTAVVMVVILSEYMTCVKFLFPYMGAVWNRGAPPPVEIANTRYAKKFFSRVIDIWWHLPVGCES